MIALIGLVIDENVLIYVPELTRENLADGRGDGDEIAYSVKPLLCLEGRRVQIEERFARQGDARTSAFVERDRVANERTNPPSRPICVTTPTLLGSKACTDATRTDGRELVERDLFAGSMLHDREVAACILRIVRVAGPYGNHLVEPVAEERVDLELVETVAVVAEARRYLFGQSPMVGQFHRRCSGRPKLEVGGRGRPAREAYRNRCAKEPQAGMHGSKPSGRTARSNRLVKSSQPAMITG